MQQQSILKTMIPFPFEVKLFPVLRIVRLQLETALLMLLYYPEGGALKIHKI